MRHFVSVSKRVRLTKPIIVGLLSLVASAGAMRAMAAPTTDRVEAVATDRTGPASTRQAWTLMLPKLAGIDFRGSVNLEGVEASPYPGMYPGGNAVALLAAVAVHGFMAQSERTRKREELQQSADKILIPYQTVLQDFNNTALFTRAANKLPALRDAAITAHVDQPAALGLITCEPVFTMAHDADALVLVNLITISPPAGLPYSNTIRVVANAANGNATEEFWLDEQGERLRDVSASMLAESIDLALRAMSESRDDANADYRTIRYFEGKSEKMERGLALGQRCNRQLIKTLRGWLMSVPVRGQSAGWCYEASPYGTAVNLQASSAAVN